MPDLERGGTPGSGGEPEAQSPLPSPSSQREAALTVIPGGKSEVASSVLDLPTFRVWALKNGLTEATLYGASRKGERNGYESREAWATFKGGKLKTGGDLTKPSDGEVAAFEAEFAAAKFPTIVPLTAIGEPPPGIDNLNGPDIYICHSLTGEVVMVHRRYETQEGGKGFLPWTYWSDGQWRCMEPEVMPFFGADRLGTFPILFLHEGAKGARRVREMIAGDRPANRFPWLEEMRWGAHVGWIGGTNAVDRSDWRGLAKARNWKRVVIVTDNDDGGISAGGEICKHFHCPTYLLRFDGNFPAQFDLGDEWPASHFDDAGHYIGPSYRNCEQPFHRATDLVEVETDSGRVKSVPVLRPIMAASYRVVTETQQVFCVDRPAMAMEKKAFNDDVRPRSDTTDTYGLLIKEAEAVCSVREYRPDRHPGRRFDKGTVRWNAYQPSEIRQVPGDPAPFLDYMAHLIPDESDRHETLRWLATLIDRRDIRMHYSLLLVSTVQGVGKSTLGLILRRLLGESNVSFPGQNSFDSAFNPWASGILLAFVDEIYTNGSAKIYDKLKSYVTDDQLEINEKNVKQYTVQNWAVFVACSNSPKALFLPDEDRRWLVPTVTNKLRERAEWEAFHAWLDGGGLGIIRNWAQDFASRFAVKKGERPPETSAKRAIVRENKSEGRLLARDFAEEFATMEPAVVRVRDLRAWIAMRRVIDLGHAHLEKERVLISELETVPGLIVWKGDDRPKIGGRRGEKESVVFNFTPEEGEKWGNLEHRLKSLEALGFTVPM